jgi:hypothetical protein
MALARKPLFTIEGRSILRDGKPYLHLNRSVDPKTGFGECEPVHADDIAILLCQMLNTETRRRRFKAPWASKPERKG